MKHQRTEARPERPLLVYPGGKWRIAQWVASHFPPHETYCEVFGGAASVLLQKERSAIEILNDRDDEIVNLYKVVRNQEQCVKLAEQLYLTLFGRSEFREAFSKPIDEIDRARQTIVKSFMAFNPSSIFETRPSTIRVEKRKSGFSRLNNLPANLEFIHERLKSVFIECDDAAQVIRKHDSPATLFYVDPPYLNTENKSGSYNCYRHELVTEDHKELLNLLKSITGKVVLSGYPSKIYSEILAGWKCVHRSNISLASTQRTECLWLNPNALAA